MVTPQQPPKPEPSKATGNREQWLTELAGQVAPLFRGFRLHEYRLTCGWPCKNALGRRRRTVGECHGLESSKSGAHEIFVSPVLADSLEVAGVVCHELGHVAAGIKAGHGAGFVKVCRHVGLTKGKPTTVMPGPRLEEKLRKIIEKLGTYPHAALVPVVKAVIKPRSSFTVYCVTCGCRAQMSKKWLLDAGLPTCGCGGLMEVKVDA